MGVNDFRPATQAVHYWQHGSRCHPAGPWDEDLLWLFGSQALSAVVRAAPRSNLRAEAGGCYTLRNASGFAMVRCPRFRHRPSHADLLHVDVWWQGENVALDGGTYSYNAPKPWNNPLAHSAFHNTVTVDDRDQMARVSRFVWLPWARGRERTYCQSAGGSLTYWEGEQNSYETLSDPVRHRRAIIRLGADKWVILDRLRGRAPHKMRLHWLLAHVPYEWNENRDCLLLRLRRGEYHVAVQSEPAGASSLVTADPDGPRGWQARYYFQREPALSLDLVVHNSAAWFVSVLGPDPPKIKLDSEGLHLASRGWRATAVLNREPAQTLVRKLSLQSEIEDSMIFSG